MQVMPLLASDWCALAASGGCCANAIAAARALRSRLDEGIARGDAGRTAAALKGEISRFSASTVCDKRELFWPRRLFNFRISEIRRIVLRYVGERWRRSGQYAQPR